MCLFITTANAQFSKGAVILEGDLSFSGSENPSSSRSSYNFGVGLSAGYLLNKQNEFGIGFGIAKNQYSSVIFGGLYQYVVKASSFSSSLYWRNYKQLGNRFLFSSQVVLTGAGGKATTEEISGGNAQTSDQKSVGIGYVPGLAYMITPKFGIRTALGLALFSATNTSNEDGWNTNYDLGISPGQLSFSLFYVLNNKE